MQYFSALSLLFFLSYFVWGLLFQVSRKVEFFPWRRLSSSFLWVSSLLKLAQWFVWALYRVRFVLSICFFVFPLMGKGEWGGNPVCWWFGLFLFCLLFRWGMLHRVLLVGGWCRVLYSSGFLCVCSHYLILLRVSSLVVKGVGVSAPTPKAQGLISGQEQDSTSGLLWHSVRLKQISQNKKPKMNPRQMGFGSYKIRQIRIKIMECTHIHPWANQNSPTKKK